MTRGGGRPVSLRAARLLVDGTERHGWWVTVAGARVVETGSSPPAGADRVDLGELDLVPGLVDLHSDCWEVRAEPRRGSPLTLAEALGDLDTEVVANGITTHFACVALEEDAGKRRSVARAAEAVGVLTAARPHLRADHRIHLRVEVTGGRTDMAEQLASAGPVGILSYMDHTPGQGQYAGEEEWRAFYLREGQTPEEADALLARRRAGQSIADQVRRRLAAVAGHTGSVLASHDDDSEATVERARSLGAAIAEFPVNDEAAKAASAAGLAVVMGAPNARRAASHLDNLSARRALEMGALDVLASDYHPASLLVACYRLADEGVCSWADAMALTTSAPARVARLADRGTLAAGRRADLVAVERRAGRPVVRQVWVAGQPAFAVVPGAAGVM